MNPAPFRVGRRRPRRASCLAASVAAVLVTLLTQGVLHAGDEEGFLTFWTEHQPLAADHTAAIEVCSRYLAGTPASAYRPAVVSIRAWHWLAAGLTNEARAGFTSLLTDATSPVSAAADATARQWLTRLDRETVRGALMRWYADHVAYPESLQPLLAGPEASQPPPKDRWGEPWEYGIERFRRLKTPPAQRYRLESRTLGRDSDLTRALAVPFGARIGVRLVRRLTDAASPTVELELIGSGRNATLMEGTSHAGIRLAKVGTHAVLLCDGNHWQVLMMPAAGGPR